MADTRPDIKLQLVTRGDFTHYDFTGDGFKGGADGDDHKTIGEIDENHPDDVRDQVIEFFDRNGDELNVILSRFRVYGARLQIRKYDE